MGKLTPAHSAGAHTARGPRAPLHCVQGSISQEYQTCTSTYPFDTPVTGMAAAAVVVVGRRALAAFNFAAAATIVNPNTHQIVGFGWFLGCFQAGRKVGGYAG